MTTNPTPVSANFFGSSVLTLNQWLNLKTKKRSVSKKNAPSRSYEQAQALAITEES